jgi:putative DNA primase/helicase
MQPGVKVDCMLILEGVQGAKKSSALEALCHDRSWFCNSPIDMRSKEGAVTLLGKWIIEIQELDAMTIRTDTYRPPYGRSPRDIHRSCVFSGTTNESAFLTDTTGNRRYWPVYCHSIDIPGLVAARDQLWGEAFEEWVSGERHWLEGHEVRLAAEVAADKMIEDPRGETIQEWADSKPDGFTMAEVMRRLEIAPERQAAAAKTVGQLLKKLGYESTRKASKAGKIRLYTKSQSKLSHAVHAVPDTVGVEKASRPRVSRDRGAAPGFGST